MPCNGDYLEPREAEKNSREVAKLLQYVHESLNENIPEAVEKASNDYYGNENLLDAFVRMLCGLCSMMTEEQQNSIIYDGKNPMARKLANWWDEHQEADRQREEQERREKVELEKSKIYALVDEHNERLLNGVEPSESFELLGRGIKRLKEEFNI